MNKYKMHFLDRHYEIDIENWNKTYSENTPFPNMVLDGFIRQHIIDKILQEFPKPNEINWRKFDNNLEKKLALNNKKDVSPALLEILNEFNNPVFLDFLSKLTGINNLIADKEFLGGGLHQIETGGKLGIHSDFGLHTINDETVYRRINVLLYLNKDWKEEYNGHLLLLDKNTKEVVKSVLPTVNTMVVFNTNSDSFHGHPIPLNTPNGITRKSLALYYYTKEKPNGEINYDTVFI